MSEFNKKKNEPEKQKMFGDPKWNKVLIGCGIFTAIVVIALAVFAYM